MVKRIKMTYKNRGLTPGPDNPKASSSQANNAAKKHSNHNNHNNTTSSKPNNANMTTSRVTRSSSSPPSSDGEAPSPAPAAKRLTIKLSREQLRGLRQFRAERTRRDEEQLQREIDQMKADWIKAHRRLRIKLHYRRRDHSSSSTESSQTSKSSSQ